MSYALGEGQKDFSRYAMDGIDGSGSMDYAANDIDGLNTIDIAGPGSRALVSFSEYDGLVTSSLPFVFAEAPTQNLIQEDNHTSASRSTTGSTVVPPTLVVPNVLGSETCRRRRR